MVVNKGNAQEYKFTDNNPNDNEAVLEITIVSKKMGSTYRLSVSESKSMMRAVPSETHKVLLPTAPRDNTSAPKAVEYHFEEPKFSNLRSLKLFLVSPSDKSVQVSLRIRKQVVNQFTYEGVSLDQQLFQRNGVTYFGVNSQSLTVRKGVYILSLTNTNKESAARVQFRFIFNDVLEMEANGMTTGYLNNSARDIIQIAYPTQSELTLSFLSCSGKMNVSYSRNELDYGNPGTQIFKEEVGANSSVFELKNFTTYNTESDVYYIQIQSLDKEPAEYALLSRQHDYAAAADSSDMIKLGKLVSVTNNQVAKHLDFNFETPVLSPESIKKVYPQASRLVIQLTAVIYGGINQVEGQVEAKIMRGIYCPKSFDRENDLIRATAQIEAAEGEFYSLPNKITIRKQVSDEYHQKLMQQGMIISFGDIGRVIPIATLYIYEKDDLEPSGIAVVHGSPTKVDASSLFVIENGLPPGNYLDTLTGKVTLIVAMLMSMLLVLTAVYFCAHRISGGYKRIEGEVKLTPDLNSSGAEMTGLKRIEETRPDESA